MHLSLLSCVLRTTQGCPAQCLLCVVRIGAASVLLGVFVLKLYTGIEQRKKGVYMSFSEFMTFHRLCYET